MISLTHIQNQTKLIHQLTSYVKVIASGKYTTFFPLGDPPKVILQMYG